MTTLFSYHGYDQWNKLHVELADDHLFVDSYYEGKAEGDHFAFSHPFGDFYVCTWDETSFNVPGSHCLWLDSTTHREWTSEAMREQPNPIIIHKDKILAAVEKYTEDWDRIFQDWSLEDGDTWFVNPDPDYFKDWTTKAKFDNYNRLVHAKGDQ